MRAFAIAGAVVLMWLGLAFVIVSAEREKRSRPTVQDWLDRKRKR